ncbi:class I SAM-dependent methyltransferase [Caldivirga maquilingensis]|uniref:Methyltransferase type 11 n=1 Tax=Caldivirga maquilingensis (strain ATCC 700844 / DSM 13496 / JCM 10307 / IC-167) TaxID=397948 RepID=A8MCH2_CALMQ|nr:methyltransferase domain-containing protein [Caldivirga maquilingensis]ABW01478.1 Methyltransferase type 11 [Caldivirga maquilingensis IC-167]
MSSLDNKAKVRELYERMGLGYLELYLEESIMGYLTLIEGVRLRGMRIIDIGCGLGVGAGLLSGIVEQYTCIDIACSLLRYPAGLPNVDAVCSDGAMLPIRSSSFNVAILLNTVNADLDGLELLKEARRVSGVVLAKSPRDIDNELIATLLRGG